MVSQRSEETAKPTNLTLTDLGVLAAAMGYTLHMRHLDDPDVLAVTDPVASTIDFAWNLTPAEQRSAIAHELGHVYHGHTCSTPAAERQANAYAADLLIDVTTYAALEREGAYAYDIAEHLCVTRDIVEAFRSTLQRLGHMTYSHMHRARFTIPLARALSPTAGEHHDRTQPAASDPMTRG